MRSVALSALIAVAAATLCSLACGTNYAYSAWGPQFAQKLNLTNTQSNLIGAAGNVGMYASGIPFGYMIDRRGPRLNTVIGAFALALGYYPLLKAYEAGLDDEGRGASKGGAIPVKRDDIGMVADSYPIQHYFVQLLEGEVEHHALLSPR